MNIHDFYKQAKAWLDQAEEAHRMAAAEKEKQTRAEWLKISDLLHEIFPFAGMTIHSTYKGQFEELPTRYYSQSVDCQIFQENRDNMKYPESDPRRCMDGVIRVTVYQDQEKKSGEWEVFYFTVWVEGQPQNFDNPNAAFLAAYENAKVEVVA